MRLGPWLMPALRVLAAMRRLRGSWLDPFGHTEERKLEHQLARDHEALVDALLRDLTPENLACAVQLAELPQRIRGLERVHPHLRRMLAGVAGLGLLIASEISSPTCTAGCPR
jgi:hypothetical protein